MIPFQGRSRHIIKLPNKAVAEGSKLWVLGDNGYAYGWLWHSGDDGPEHISKKGVVAKKLIPKWPKTVHLAPTFAIVIRLAERPHEYHPKRVFCFYLDNLFLNTSVAHVLLAMNFCCRGTTRKDAQGVPTWLIEMKTAAVAYFEIQRLEKLLAILSAFSVKKATPCSALLLPTVFFLNFIFYSSIYLA
jgi:Transposase IS4